MAHRPYSDPQSWHDLGQMQFECQHCQGLHWLSERNATPGRQLVFGMLRAWGSSLTNATSSSTLDTGPFHGLKFSSKGVPRSYLGV